MVPGEIFEKTVIWKAFQGKGRYVENTVNQVDLVAISRPIGEQLVVDNL
jgi:hypothetical protein